jgi:fatty acid desaturase
MHHRTAENTTNTAAFDPSAIDFAGFHAELRELRKQIDADLGARDLKHLRRVERFGKLATALGLATAPLGPNPLSMAGLALGRSARWILMHHIGHRGYDAVPGVPAKYTSRVFARGKRRYLDWADWMIPEVWIYEHNVLHHSHLSEELDPDLVERNAKVIREGGWSLAQRYLAVAGLGISWKAVYYAPNTLRVWRNRLRGQEANQAATTDVADLDRAGTQENGTRNARAAEGHERELWLRCYLPYAALQFGLLPAAFLPLGPLAAASALANSVGAELLANLHTFLVIGPNHCGEDLYRFSTAAKSKAEWMLRQILGSTNYATGDELTDCLHLYLNYQIEHHIWPDLPMLRYREVQPKVKALCAKYGIPYVQESVFVRAKKMVDIAIGKTSMKRSDGLTAR